MRVVLQQVQEAKVTVEEKIIGQIKKGFLLYVGFTQGDSLNEVEKLANKISKLRIFADDEDKMNLSLQDVAGEILSISQFTLYGNTKKGNRPSFTEAMDPTKADELYHSFNEHLRLAGFKVETGVFGAHMMVESINDGPSTFILEA